MDCFDARSLTAWGLKPLQSDLGIGDKQGPLPRIFVVTELWFGMLKTTFLHAKPGKFSARGGEESGM